VVASYAFLKLFVRQTLDQLREDGLAKIHGPLSQASKDAPKPLDFRPIEFKSFPA